MDGTLRICFSLSGIIKIAETEKVFRGDMEEKLIEELQSLTEAINKNAVPLWISVVGVIVPIVLSIAVIVQAWVQHRQNKKLQSNLSNKDIKVQMHSDFLKIYDDFCIAQNTLGRAEKDLIKIFSY